MGGKQKAWPNHLNTLGNGRTDGNVPLNPAGRKIHFLTKEFHDYNAKNDINFVKLYTFCQWILDEKYRKNQDVFQSQFDPVPLKLCR